MGTTTVRVVPSSLFCRTTWLPACLTGTNPNRSKALMASLPETLGSFGTLNGHFKGRYERMRRQSGLDFLFRGCFEIKGNGFLEVLHRIFDRFPLAGDVELGAKGDVPFALLLDDGREFIAHKSSLTDALVKINVGRIAATQQLGGSASICSEGLRAAMAGIW